VTGQCPSGMEDAIPGFASWQLSSVPRFLAADESICQAHLGVRRDLTAAAPGAAFPENGGAGRVSVASAAPAPRRAPPRAGRHASRTVAAATAASVGSTHSNPAGRSSHRKKSLVMTLAASGTASFSGGFRSLTRFRYRRLCPFRVRLPAAVAR
jgi:hypothetical protein